MMKCFVFPAVRVEFLNIICSHFGFKELLDSFYSNQQQLSHYKSCFSLVKRVQKLTKGVMAASCLFGVAAADISSTLST